MACVVGVATILHRVAFATSQLLRSAIFTGRFALQFRSDVRNERLPGPCSWVDTIAEVVEHRSADHAFG
jgi:phospholipase C